MRNFSTAEVHPRDRLAYWYDFVCESLVYADYEIRRDQPFFGEIRVDAAGELQVATMAATVQQVTRSPRHIAHDGADSFAVTINRAGTNLFSQDGHDAVLRPGDLVLLDMTRPFTFRVGSDFRQIVLLFPRTALFARLGAVAPYIGRRVDGAAGVGGMLSPLLCALPAQLETIPAALRDRLAGNVLDLNATALGSQDDQRAFPAGMTLVRAKLWIEAHLAEELSAERVAAGCRLSVRYLNHLFEREGTSLMRYVWERRLVRCHRDLGDPVLRGRRIGDIAFAAGFNDFSHFSRAYHARYGCTARDTRFLASRHGLAIGNLEMTQSLVS